VRAAHGVLAWQLRDSRCRETATILSTSRDTGYRRVAPREDQNMTRTLMAALLAGSALAPTGPVAAQEKPELTVAVQKIPDLLEPVLENSNVHLRVMYSIYDKLVRVDYRDGGTLKPALATDWEIVDPKTIEFQLREGVMFHNGEEMTAEDVAFTFSQERLNQTGEGGTVVVEPFIGGIASAEVLDRYRVRITMETDDALILQRFANYPAQIVSKKGFEDAGSWEAWRTNPVGTGPYRVKEFVFGERVVLEAFDDHWDAPAAAFEVTFTVVPEIATRIAGLRSGQFDIITEVGPDHIAEIENADGVSVTGGPILNIRGIIYDSTNDVLDDPRIRRAMTMSIDREAIVEQLYGGRTEYTRGWQMPAFGEMYLGDWPYPPYDPARAKALLAEAGYDGEQINYRTLQGYYTNELETAQILAAMWQNIGLNVNLDVKENWSQINEDTPDRHIINGSFTAYYPDPVGQLWRRFGPDGAFAQRGFFEVDGAFREDGRTLVTNVDTAARRDAFRAMLEHFRDDPDGATLHALTQFYGVRDAVNWEPFPTQYMDLSTNSLSFE
jgi:peptide/nickel transport system substrate-binding protein